jgi:topoisomerase-4 subunit A
VRAKLDTSDPKRIVIRELPFGSTTESIIDSIESAAKAGRIKIQSISDFTTENVEIEIKLARGVYSEEMVDALFAFTDCEQSISVNLLVIKNNLPVVMTVTEIIKHHAGQLVRILTKELEIEKKELQDKLHLRTLERIFIEERIYKGIEKMKTAEGVEKAVLDGFKPFMKEVGSRGISHDDVEHLLRIPIRRISLYDINRARNEMQEIAARIKEINAHLRNIVAYSLSCLDGLIAKIKNNEEVGRGRRKTRVGTFEKVDVKEVVKKDLELKYDRETGYLGTAVSGDVVAEVSPLTVLLLSAITEAGL